MEVIKGIPVSPGIAIGRAFVLDDQLERVPYRAISESEVTAELSRLDRAIVAAAADVALDRDRARDELGEEPAKIFEFHLGMLNDQALLAPVRDKIAKERVSADYAVSDVLRALADRFRGIGDEVFRQKASDIMDLDRRLLGKLVGVSSDRLAKVDEPVIVIAHELTPAQAASLDVSKVTGCAMDAGGRTSHTSIVAAALGIPVVVGCHHVSTHISDGDLLIIDGKSGVVVLRPDRETLDQYEREQEQMAGISAGLRDYAALESVTTDGVRIELMGNIEFAREVENLLSSGGDGVGLYRTEFLHLTSPTVPTEQDHFEAYKLAIELLAGRPLTIRTLDLGADKYTQERSLEQERNPFLGLRSIRYCLQNLGLFKTQLRAVLRASAHGPVRIMFPLVSTVMELRQARMILSDVMDECREEGIQYDRDMPVGIMIEVPSAALLASAFAREVDFFSIGTNDLIQYTLAVDRGNERVANLYTGANPAVIKLIKDVIRAGRRFKVDTSICGEIAGEVLYTMLLLGLGLRTLSLVPAQIPAVKQVIRAVDIPTCERLARKVGSFDSERRVLKALRDELRRIVPTADGGWSAD